MKKDVIVVTGATGHVGGRLAERLLAAGRHVRIVGRSEERLRGLASLGADTEVGSVEDPQVMKRALVDASAVFLMIPPNPAAKDFLAWQKQVVASYATALRESGTPFAVTLSSIGGHLAQGTGPIVGLHYLEGSLNAIRGLNVVHLRPGFFMENHLYSLHTIRASGLVIGQLRPDLPMPMIATVDVGDAAAQLLLHLTFHGSETRELLGQRDLTMAEVTGVLGRAIRSPQLRYMQAEYDAVEKAMMGMGMSADVAHRMIEMGRAFNEGFIRPQERRTPANTTPTSIEDFALRVFEPAFRQMPPSGG